MKIAYFGDGPWAHNALHMLLSNGFEVCVVVVRYDFQDSILKEIATSNKIDVIWHKRINSGEFVEMIKAYEADLCVSMSFNQIFKAHFIDLFSKGAINCHAGKLPYYRGRNILNWAIINGENEFGITCHYIDEGIDTGDIIVQKTYPIEEDDDYSTILKKAHLYCSEVLLEGVTSISNGEVKRIPQTTYGTYYTQRCVGDEFVDWNQLTSKGVFNFVRGITTPGPCARTWLNVKDSNYLEVKIEKVRLLEEFPEYNCIPGAVVGYSESGNPIVKTADTIIELMSFKVISENAVKLRIGDRLGINYNLVLMKLASI